MMKMTRAQFSEVTGVSMSALRFYEKKGLLNPERTGEGVSNNRRLYSDDDFQRMQEIMIYLKLGMPIKGIGAKLNSPDYDSSRAFDEAMRVLHARIEHLQNIEMLAGLAKSFGATLFDFVSFDDDDIDSFADQMRNSPVFRKGFQRGFEFASNLSAGESRWRLYMQRGLLLKYADLTDSLNVSAQEIEAETIKRLLDLADECVELNEPFLSWGQPEAIYIYALSLVMADGEIAKGINEFAGDGVSEIVGISLILTWYVRMATHLNPYLSGLLQSRTDGARHPELLAGLMSAISDCVISSENQEMIARIHGEESVFEYIEGALSEAADLYDDSIVEILSKATGAVYPPKEAFTVAVDVLRENYRDLKDGQT
ncbi:MAG: MerR family transcriptional regulator [Bacteroidales bacterium]|nr:MerR family transcriptional regulator [Bacteroidales bacterium]